MCATLDTVEGYALYRGYGTHQFDHLGQREAPQTTATAGSGHGSGWNRQPDLCVAPTGIDGGASGSELAQAVGAGR